MKIYELRSASEGDAESCIEDQDQEGFLGAVLQSSSLFSSLERAQLAADEEHQELHIECLTQEEIDSNELSDNVVDDLDWTIGDGGRVWQSHSEPLGMTWVIREHEISD